jgi:thymidine kinase
VAELCPDSIIKLTAICFYCRQEASFSLRLTNETNLKVVGGKDKYAAACRACYVRKHTIVE